MQYTEQNKKKHMWHGSCLLKKKEKKEKPLSHVCESTPLKWTSVGVSVEDVSSVKPALELLSDNRRWCNKDLWAATTSTGIYYCKYSQQQSSRQRVLLVQLDVLESHDTIKKNLWCTEWFRNTELIFLHRHRVFVPQVVFVTSKDKHMWQCSNPSLKASFTT